MSHNKVCPTLPQTLLLRRACAFDDPLAALACVQALYQEQVDTLRDAMRRFVAGEQLSAPVHAYYPLVRIETHTVARADTKLAYGFVEGPGRYDATSPAPTCLRATCRSSSACCARTMGWTSRWG
jgi:hypothetical protein